MAMTAALYARISVATEESVSVARQLESCRAYAAARGWQIVAEWVDEGVSATANRPADRAAWRGLMTSTVHFDAVVIWKVDRLARRVIDFMQTDEQLQRRGAAIACVEQSIDMTTAEGRAFAQMLAVFAEMEAGAISARITAARAHLIQVGRSPGGRPPYGWVNVPNPDGPGRVRAHDPDRIEWVRAMADRALRGDTVNSILRWIQASDAPVPRYRDRESHRWSYSMINHLLTNPTLAGMIPCNPGTRSIRGPEVYRDADGAPVVDHKLAVVTVEEHERLKHLIANKTHHAAKPVALRWRSPALLSGLVTCGECNDPMWRAGGSKQFGLTCRTCGMFITATLVREHVVAKLLEVRGDTPMHRKVTVVADDPATSAKLADLDHALREAATSLTLDFTDPDAVNAEIIRLKQRRQALRHASAGLLEDRLIPLAITLAEAWKLCATDDHRRVLLTDQVATITVTRDRYPGRSRTTRRVHLTWRRRTSTVIPDGLSLDAVHIHTPAEVSPWVSVADAARIAGCSQWHLRQAALRGAVIRRDNPRQQASISRASAEAYRATR